MACLSACDAVILAGGAGSRLRPVLPDRPKVLAPVGGVPFLRHLLEQVRSFGTRRVILALGHLAEAVEGYLAGESWGGLELVTSVEREPLGTGGALRSVLPLLRTPTVLVMNGDSLTQGDLCALLAFHRAKAAAASLLLTRMEEASRYSTVDTDAGGRVVAYREKTQAGTGDISAGIYLMERAAVEAMPSARPVSLERDIFPGLCGRGLYGMRGRFPFIDIGTPTSYEAAQDFVRAGASQ